MRDWLRQQAGFTVGEALLAGVILVPLVLLGGYVFKHQQRAVKDAQARASLVAAYKSAKVYAKEHGDTYDGLNAGRLAQMEPKLEFVSQGWYEPASKDSNPKQVLMFAGPSRELPDARLVMCVRSASATTYCLRENMQRQLAFLEGERPARVAGVPQ